MLPILSAATSATTSLQAAGPFACRSLKLKPAVSWHASQTRASSCLLNCASELTSHVTRPILPSLGNLNKLMDLELSDNRLSAGIPVALLNLTELNTLSLEMDELTGSIPHEIGLLHNLSFGVVVLEIMMGMYPTELESIASMGQRQELEMEDILDKRPSLPTIAEKKEIVLLVEVAFACLQTAPQYRPEMQDVYQKLVMHKPHHSASPSHGFRLEEIREV
nr:unnamed protein product [Digitaria exilis]